MAKRKRKAKKAKKPIVESKILPAIVPVFNNARCGSETIIDHEERIFEIENLVVYLLKRDAKGNEIVDKGTVVPDTELHEPNEPDTI